MIETSNIDSKILKSSLEYQEKRKLDWEELQEFYNNTNMNQVRNISISKKNIRRNFIDKKTLTTAITETMLLSEVSTIQLTGAKILKDNIMPYIDNSFYSNYLNDGLSNPKTTQTENFEKHILINLCQEITKYGYSIDEIAVVLDYGKGIKSQKIPNSTFLGRISAKTAAALNKVNTREMIEKGAKK